MSKHANNAIEFNFNFEPNVHGLPLVVVVNDSL